jgi:hypothetical protein
MARRPHLTGARAVAALIQEDAKPHIESLAELKPTAEQARSFFAQLVDCAVGRMPDQDVVPAGWPVDVMELTPDGQANGGTRALSICGHGER